MAMHSLPLFLRLGGRPVILLGDGEAAAAKRRLLERAGAAITDDPDAPVALAIIALDGADADAAAARLKARGVLVNVVDRPELCDFTVPAIVDRDPVLVAIGTGGASAGLAKQLRLRLEALLPPRLGALAAALAAARATLRARLPEPRDRKVAIDAALARGGALDPLLKRDEDGDEAARVAAWLDALAAPAAGTAQMVDLVVVSTDPDDLTLRAARLLGEADVVVHHPDIAPAILARARADAVIVALAAAHSAPATGLRVILRPADMTRS